jgi:hypothetical protein
LFCWLFFSMCFEFSRALQFSTECLMRCFFFFNTGNALVHKHFFLFRVTDFKREDVVDMATTNG